VVSLAIEKRGSKGFAPNLTGVHMQDLFHVKTVLQSPGQLAPHPDIADESDES
jgi:hypothetical protein